MVLVAGGHMRILAQSGVIAGVNCLLEWLGRVAGGRFVFLANVLATLVTLALMVVFGGPALIGALAEWAKNSPRVRRWIGPVLLPFKALAAIVLMLVVPVAMRVARWLRIVDFR